MSVLIKASSGAAVFVFALVLSGCSGAESGGSGGVTAETSPLAPYSLALWGDTDPSADERESIEIEDAIAECMTEEGFEYRPETRAATMGIITNVDPENPNSDEWATQRGYNIVQTIDDAAGDGQELDEGIAFNENYAASLSESEGVAYGKTLYGPHVGQEPNPDDGPIGWEQLGCRGEAEHQVLLTSQGLYADPQFAALATKMNEMYLGLADEPRFIEIDRDWSDCMAAAGLSGLGNKSAATQSIQAEYGAIVHTPEWDPLAATAEQRASLEALKAQEIKLALVDFDCSQEVDYLERAAAVSDEIEKQFVEDNKAELDEMLAASILKK